MKRLLTLTLFLALSSLTWGQSLQGPHQYAVNFGQVPVGEWSSDYQNIWWPLWITQLPAGSTLESVQSTDAVTIFPTCQLPWIVPDLGQGYCLVYLSVKPVRKGWNLYPLTVNLLVANTKQVLPAQLLIYGK